MSIQYIRSTLTLCEYSLFYFIAIYRSFGYFLFNQFSVQLINVTKLFQKLPDQSID